MHANPEQDRLSSDVSQGIGGGAEKPYLDLFQVTTCSHIPRKHVPLNPDDSAQWLALLGIPLLQTAEGKWGLLLCFESTKVLWLLVQPETKSLGTVSSHPADPRTKVMHPNFGALRTSPPALISTPP